METRRPQNRNRNHNTNSNNTVTETDDRITIQEMTTQGPQEGSSLSAKYGLKYYSIGVRMNSTVNYVIILMVLKCDVQQQIIISYFI